ncbi:hypothetical protein [Alteromonas sp. a30]|uniref:hypothetical protein n=1 Tax=Alteromonas sp. a30 TaxID=2730917 RepID=UPI00227F9F08|nr:hypothetical protein [Alteromonas sp. a30]MCY7294512.1 hypothetical protein [Alteromonas sp. a30]
MKLKSLACCLALLSANTLATPITITNPDLDSQVLSDGAFTNSVQGWAVIDGYAGVYNPPESLIIGEAGAGSHENVLYLNGDSLVTQTLNTNLASDTDYTLTFDVGDRLDTNFPNYIVKVKAGGNTVFTAINPLIPNGGAFSPVTLTFSTGQTATAGNPIVIEVEAKDNGQVLLDNFTLDAVAGSGNTTSQFGQWNHPALGGQTYAVSTVYQASTDGFIIYLNGGKCTQAQHFIQVGDTPSPDALVSRLENYGSMTAPVRSGQYWRVLRVRGGNDGTCSDTIGFLPLNP